MRLKTLKSKFPLYTERLKIATVGKRDLDSYINEIKQPYYTEYLDNKAIGSMSKAEAKLKLASLIATYNLPYEFKYEFRLLIRDKETNKIYGGLTLNPIHNSELEISYWLIPMYNGNGYCTEALIEITKFIARVFKECKYTKLEIQEANTKSIRLAERCGYVEYDRVQGKYSKNLIYKFNLDNYRAKVGVWH